MNKARITFKLDSAARNIRSLNGNEETDHSERVPGSKEENVIPLFKEEYEVLRDKPISAPLNDYVQDYGAWQSPYDAETARIEKLIRQTGIKQEPAATFKAHSQASLNDEASYNGATGYYRPEPTSYERDHPVITDSRNDRTYLRRGPTAWHKITLSVIGAVATGALLGFFVLSLFSDNSPSDLFKWGSAAGTDPQTNSVKTGSDKETVASQILSENGKTDVAQKEGAGTESVKTENLASSTAQKTAAASVLSVNIPARSYTVIQNGVFSTAQSAEKVQIELRDKGFAAVTEPGQTYYVYMGISATRDSANGISKLLKDRKLDIYAKSYTIPAVTKMHWNGKADTIQTYLTQTDKLIAMAAGLSLIHLEETKPTPIEEASLQAMSALHTLWSGAAGALGEGIPNEGKVSVQKLNTALQDVKVTMDDYKKNPTSAALWKMQTLLLQAAMAQKEFIQALTVT